MNRIIALAFIMLSSLAMGQSVFLEKGEQFTAPQEGVFQTLEHEAQQRYTIAELNQLIDAYKQASIEKLAISDSLKNTFETIIKEHKAFQDIQSSQIENQKLTLKQYAELAKSLQAEANRENKRKKRWRRLFASSLTVNAVLILILI